MAFALDGQRRFALHHENHALHPCIGLGPRAAAARHDFHYILAEGLRKSGHRTGDDPGARLVPMGQIARDDIGHHAARDQRIGFGEHRAAGMERHLRWQAGCG